MRGSIGWAVVAYAWAGGVWAEEMEKDAVHELPGWEGVLPSKMYSGYVDVEVNATRMWVHYWLIESEKDPASDPVLLWSNGGPGASSMFGVLVELGPLILSDDSLTDKYEATGVPELLRNEYAWTKLGSVLMFDWAPPVGFSHCGDPSGDGPSCGAWTDELMADLEKKAVDAWYAKFPTFRTRDLYIIGESYAGVYVPLLVEKILDDVRSPSPLVGFAVGDACAGTDVLCGGSDAPWWNLIFLYGHGQISNAAFDAVLESCGLDYLKSAGLPPPSPRCASDLANATSQVGWYYGYNLYDTCTYEEGLRRRRTRRRRLAAVHDYACGGGNVQELWVNLTDVRRALNVPADSYFYSADGDDAVYTLTEPDVTRVYRKAADRGLRMLVYNGDTDPGINSFVAQNWTAGLFPLLEPWRPWTLDACLAVGGYVIKYANDFHYLTIRGSGHMVPEFMPKAAFAFLSDWLQADDFKRYDPDCTSPDSILHSASSIDPDDTFLADQLASWDHRHQQQQ